MDKAQVWLKVVEMLVQVKAATKRDVNGKAAAFRLPVGFEMCALNVADQFGNSYDLEVGSASEFESCKIFDPRVKAFVEFTPPAIGDWIEVLNCRVGSEVDSYGKKKIRIDSGWQLRKMEISGAAAVEAKARPVAGRRVRKAV
jgi:hypothetical protein